MGFINERVSGGLDRDGNTRGGEKKRLFCCFDVESVSFHTDGM